MFLAESETEPSCTTALNAQTSDPYVYYVYSIMHMSDVLSLFVFLNLFVQPLSHFSEVQSSKDLYMDTCIHYTVSV